MAEKTIPVWVWIEMEQGLSPRLNHPRRFSLGGLIPRVRALTAWQPRWKLVMSSALVIAIIATISALVPGLLGPSPEVLAAQIAAGDPGVTALLQGTPTTQTTVVSASKGYVMTEGPSGETILAYVDLPTGTVFKVYRLTVPSLTEEDRVRIIGLAIADPGLREVIRQEFTVRDVSLLPSRFRLELADGQPRLWNEDMLARVMFRTAGQTWIAVVDLIQNKVVQVYQPQLTGEEQPPPSWFYVNPPYSPEALVNVASAALKPRNYSATGRRWSVPWPAVRWETRERSS